MSEGSVLTDLFSEQRNVVSVPRLFESIPLEKLIGFSNDYGKDFERPLP